LRIFSSPYHKPSGHALGMALIIGVIQGDQRSGID
jgi:hypothetical protein